MKALDKIYLHPDDRHWWHEGNKTDDRFVEYIRKDALMEWAKEHQEGERQGSYTLSCYQIFIDKLNEI